MADRKAQEYSGTTINSQSNTYIRINKKSRWSGERRSSARRRTFSKLCDIRDSKQDSLAARVSVSLKEDENIFKKRKDWSMGTLNSSYKVYGVPS